MYKTTQEYLEIQNILKRVDSYDINFDESLNLLSYYLDKYLTNTTALWLSEQQYKELEKTHISLMKENNKVKKELEKSKYVLPKYELGQKINMIEASASQSDNCITVRGGKWAVVTVPKTKPIILVITKIDTQLSVTDTEQETIHIYTLTEEDTGESLTVDESFLKVYLNDK